ncbi:MAG TPA: PepSY-associated TM helix domain-containing protein [Xanthomonadaceae bacterium]|jgi:hypothetical protein
MATHDRLHGKRRMHRIVRQLHLWIGAWGAIAAIGFGSTGFVQNHRAILKLPQGDSIDAGQVELPVPESARANPDAMRQWLHGTLHADIGKVRVQAGKPFDYQGQRVEPPAHWTLNGGNAHESVQAEYVAGSASLTVRTTRQGVLATLLRLHKGVGAGPGWILLTDSFAISMVMLGISGLWMWGRARTPRQMVFSAVGAAVAVLLIVGGLQVA